MKYTAVKPPGSARFIRLSSLGVGYTEAEIKARLAASRTGTVQKPQPPPMGTPRRYRVVGGSVHNPKRRKLRGFRALYVHYLYFLGIRKSGKSRKPVPFSIRKEVTRLCRYQRQFRLLQTYHIDTGPQLSMLEDALQGEIDALTGQRKVLYSQKRRGEDVSAEINGINQSLRQLRRYLKTCFQIEADVPRIQEQVPVCYRQRAQEKEAQQKQHTEKSKQKHKRKFRLEME